MSRAALVAALTSSSSFSTIRNRRLISAATTTAAMSATARSTNHNNHTSSSVRITPTEIALECSDGIRLTGQSWRSPSLSSEASSSTEAASVSHRILCLHGWMNNCRSFYHLAPRLVQQQEGINVHVVALDFPGHGLSSHKSADGPPMVLAEGAFYVAEALRQLGWSQPDAGSGTSQKKADSDSSETQQQQQSQDSSIASPPHLTLIGHSMGAAVGCLYAAAFPEQIQRLVLLEGGGPLASHARDVSKYVRAHVERRMLQSAPAHVNSNRRRPYPSLEAAVAARCRTARQFPGKQWLSVEAATEMVQWGSTTVNTHQGEDNALANESANDDEADDADAANNNGAKKGSIVQFRHDPRLQWPSVQYFTLEQTEALYQDISCPTALLLADDAWPFDQEKLDRMLELLQPTLYKKLPGSHHFHSDEASAPAVTQEVLQFLNLA